MANSNVIELVVKLKDQVSSGLASLGSKLGGIGGLVAGLAGIATVGAALHKTISASEDAEDAVVKFDLAFKNLGATSRKTRDDIVKFADDTSKKAIFDDESILRAQTALLKFRSVAGPTFDRARQAAVDMASAMGGDVVQAANLVGRAIERPEVAIRQLRAAGVVFSRDQEQVIKQLAETGHRGQAAGIVLTELEKRFKGAADAAAGTLSGSLSILKTAFNNLFEVNPGPLTEAVKGLADVFNDPDFRTGIQTILEMMIKLVSYAGRYAAFIGRGVSAISEAAKNVANSPQVLGDALQQMNPLNSFQNMGINAALTGDAIASVDHWDKLNAAADEAINTIINGADDAGKAFGEMSDVVVKSFVQPKSAMKEFYDSLNDSTHTAGETAQQSFDRTKAQLNALFDAGAIDAETFNKRLQVAIDDGLDEVKVISGHIVTAIKTPFDVMVDDVSAALDRMLNNAQFSWRALGQYLLREVLSGAIKRAIDALASSLKKAMSVKGSGGGLLGSVTSFLGSVFGGSAGGGQSSGPRWVGENGPELAGGAGAMRVYNLKQLAGMGGGGMTYRGGDVNVVVKGDADHKTARMIAELVEVRLAQQERSTLRMLERNGLARPR